MKFRPRPDRVVVKRLSKEEKGATPPTDDANFKTERVHIALEPDELKAIDDFRYAHRMPTRSSAIRQLISYGLASVEGSGPAIGEIVAVGVGAQDEQGRPVRLDVKKGDRVLFGKWSGTEVRIDGHDLLIMKESDITGVIGTKK